MLPRQQAIGKIKPCVEFPFMIAAGKTPRCLVEGKPPGVELARFIMHCGSSPWYKP